MDVSRRQTDYTALVRPYLSHRSELKSDAYVTKLVKKLHPHSSILDLGCGAGVPVDNLILKAGHSVVGIDISEGMIAAARQACPGGLYSMRDMRTLKMGEYTVDAVISFYALFHIPRGEQGRILKTIRSFLAVGGLILVTMGDTDYEGTTDLYGTPLWWSQWGPTTNRKLVSTAGFDIILDEMDHSGGETHHVIMARAL